MANTNGGVFLSLKLAIALICLMVNDINYKGLFFTSRSTVGMIL